MRNHRPGYVLAEVSNVEESRKSELLSRIIWGSTASFVPPAERGGRPCSKSFV